VTADSPEALTPTAISQKDDRHLLITWQDGHESVLDVVLLRQRCPCASCIEEWTGKPLLDQDAVPDSVRPESIRSVGLYALSIDFSDGHSTGIYPFPLLRSLCSCPACRDKNLATAAT